MTREAALLGIPSYSFFRGRAGSVDEKLAAEGKLTLLSSKVDVLEKLAIVNRERAVVPPDSAALVTFIADAIVGAAGAS